MNFLSLFSKRKKYPYEVKVDKIRSLANQLSDYQVLIIAEGFERDFINGLHKRTKQRVLEEIKDREPITSIYNRLCGEKVRFFSNIELPTDQLTTIGTYKTLQEALKARQQLHGKAGYLRRQLKKLGAKRRYKLSVKFNVIDKRTGKIIGNDIWGQDPDRVCFSVLAQGGYTDAD